MVKFIARTEFDAPEIDSEVVVAPGGNAKVGSFVEMIIDDAYEHDLYGTAV